ncbi:MAG: peptidoglycan-binding domain-containing protein [Candidatus Paceibacterota bacterium]|jgi:peptidoglycan hydrolase-like protein with peptidoglycan-binding domain
MPTVVKASFFDDLLSRVRNMINGINLNTNNTNNVDNINDSEPITDTNFSASGFCFVNEMQFGDRNNDVKELQKVLAQFSDIYPEKLVTGYFGSLTKQAVIRFQNKFKSEILTPTGLKQGTGYVGQYTLNKLNALNNCFEDQNNTDLTDNNIDINIGVSDELPIENNVEPTPIDNYTDNNDKAPITEPSLPTVKIKTYCSQDKEIYITNSLVNSSTENVAIRHIAFTFANENYSPANNVTINIGNQTVNVGTIDGCKDEEYKAVNKNVNFDYQCINKEKDTDVVVKWYDDQNVTHSFEKKINVTCYQCEIDTSVLGTIKYTIYGSTLDPDNIAWHNVI